MYYVYIYIYIYTHTSNRSERPGAAACGNTLARTRKLSKAPKGNGIGATGSENPRA